MITNPVQGYAGLVLRYSVIPLGCRSLAVPLSLLVVHTASLTSHCKTQSEHYFCFSPFSLKGKQSSLDLFQVAKTGINVDPWKANFCKAEIPEYEYTTLFILSPLIDIWMFSSF